MLRWVLVLGAASLAVALAASWDANAQTLQPQAKRQAATGRQIVVRPGKSYLTAGTANVSSHNNYVLDTFAQPLPTAGTFTGMRGQERLLNRFDGPGIPLFRF